MQTDATFLSAFASLRTTIAPPGRSYSRAETQSRQGKYNSVLWYLTVYVSWRMPNKKLLFSVLFCFLVSITMAQPKTDTLLKSILYGSKSAILKQVLQNPTEYRQQIMYTQINRDKNNKPTFTNYYYNFDPLRYYYPASTVKLPLALLSLEKLNEMNVPGVDKFTPMQFDSGYNPLKPEFKDSTAENGLPSIAQFIRKAFLVSDNDAYNRMYEFVGQQTINRQLHAKGYTDARILRHFYKMTYDQNSHTNQIRFIKGDGTTIYTQPPAYNTDTFDFSHVNKLGIGYLDGKDSLVYEPMDFTKHNNISLYDYQQILQSVMFPQSVPEKQRFNLTKDDYSFLYRYLSQFPSETNYPKYDTATYFDTYVKFFFMDSLSKTMPEGVRVFNKVGWAYGTLTDISYVVDFKHNVEFMLAATIYANSDGILNDDKYDFETVAHPFMYSVGQAVYQYELQRKRKYAPDLSAFKIPYKKRVDDNRQVIKAVDN
jgi:hypothetical protein